MNHGEVLCLKLMEECAEVQQRVAKLMQYGAEESQETAPNGLGGSNPPTGTNRERLQAEICDMCAVIELLGYRYPTKEEVSAKCNKIIKYMEYSKSLGLVVSEAAPSTDKPDFSIGGIARSISRRR